MNRKTIFCTIALTALLIGGCGQSSQNNAKGTENASGTGTSSSSASESAMPSVNAGTTQNTSESATQSHSDAAQGSSEEGTMISEEKAKEIALAHAGLTADQVTFVKSGIDREDGRKEYDIEFYTKDRKEYDYEIDPYTGEVLNYDYDAEYHTQASESANGTAATNGTDTANGTGTTDSKTITTDEAKQIALSKIPGATDKDIREFKSEYDNSKLQYEGKIYYDKKEYEFEIDGSNGAILEWDVESIYGGS